MKRNLRDAAIILVSAVVAVGIALIIVVAALSVHRAVEGEATRSSPLCTEDMECWDCETMGNRICGVKAP